MISWRLMNTPHQKAADSSHVPNQPTSRPREDAAGGEHDGEEDRVEQLRDDRADEALDPGDERRAAAVADRGRDEHRRGDEQTTAGSCRRRAGAGRRGKRTARSRRPARPRSSTSSASRGKVPPAPACGLGRARSGRVARRRFGRMRSVAADAQQSLAADRADPPDVLVLALHQRVQATALPALSGVLEPELGVGRVSDDRRCASSQYSIEPNSRAHHGSRDRVESKTPPSVLGQRCARVRPRCPGRRRQHGQSRCRWRTRRRPTVSLGARDDHQAADDQRDRRGEAGQRLAGTSLNEAAPHAPQAGDEMPNSSHQSPKAWSWRRPRLRPTCGMPWLVRSSENAHSSIRRTPLIGDSTPIHTPAPMLCRRPEEALAGVGDREPDAHVDAVGAQGMRPGVTDPVCRTASAAHGVECVATRRGVRAELARAGSV